MVLCPTLLNYFYLLLWEFSNGFCINHGTLNLTSNPQTFYFPKAFQRNVYHLVMSTTYRQVTKKDQVLDKYTPIAYGSYTTSSFFAKSDINGLWDYIAAGY